jgi:hypothetical protein
MEINAQMLPVCRANELEIQPPEKLWLIEPLWAQCAVAQRSSNLKQYLFTIQGLTVIAVFKDTKITV